MIREHWVSPSRLFFFSGEFPFFIRTSLPGVNESCAAASPGRFSLDQKPWQPNGITTGATSINAVINSKNRPHPPCED